ncbi:DUF3375 family protein [Hymenobacter psoromatis]|uniref:DUF3375 family protein n=1 Tax=Hymenobacter psoromatis TaxID=1484116 RepID=UPI001CBD2B3B|nr:DUF3375 family protein [Hymenobacter psoromatis]
MSYPLYRGLFSADRAPAAVRVLRSHEAALVLCFLQENFKAGSYAPVRANDWLAGQLADFLETWDVRGDDDAGDLPTLGLSWAERAARLLRDWVRKGYLTLYTDEQGADQHTLTPELESVLDWVQSLLHKPTFVGTESRFLDILQKLRELVQNSADDWQARLAELEKQRSALDAQIRELKLTKTVRTYEDYEVAERYQTVSGVARGLLRDFREVEGNFRDITQRIYQQQAAAGHTKGGLLGLALDALDELRLTAQGRSFEAFYRHLNDPRQRAELDALVRQVFELLTDRGLETGDEFLRKIRPYLLGEGRKVNDSFYALARKLEKILSEKNLRDRRKSLALIHDIRALAFAVMDNPPTDPAFLELEGRADYLTTESTVALKERESAIVPRVLAVARPEEPELAALVSPRVVDKARLAANISALLRDQSQITLRQVVAAHALRHGVPELMAYGSIAANSPKHLINRQQKDIFDLGDGRWCEFPEVIFCR